MDLRELGYHVLTCCPNFCNQDNIRMAMESTIGLAYAMCRTLVMPPEKRMYLLGQGGKTQKQYVISEFID